MRLGGGWRGLAPWVAQRWSHQGSGFGIRMGLGLGLYLALLLVGVSLTGPSLTVQRAQAAAVVVLDITQSMLVADQFLNPDQPGARAVSRLDLAKARIDAALQRLPCGSQLGWAIFTEYRSLLLLAPLEVCAHQVELREALQRIGPAMAWASASEVAKGINGGLEAVRELPDQPALVFVTDGQESPPVNPAYRPRMTVARGEVRGLLVGVGGDVPQAIPHVDPFGRVYGVWAASEVMQVDPRSLGRGGSVAGEGLVDTESKGAGAPRSMPGATPGREHLSALREGYLQLLANELGLGYLRLGGVEPLVDALRDASMTRAMASRLDLRPWLLGLAWLCVVGPLLVSVRRRKGSGTALQPAQPGWLAALMGRLRASFASRPQR